MSGTWAIIQARTGSSRLPGKVLMDIKGKPMLTRVVERARAARGVNGVLIATSSLSQDDPVARLCDSMGQACFRGSETDVLDRYRRAVEHVGADVVVRLTADCPLLDPEVIDGVIDTFSSTSADYASNTLAPRTFPRGLDTEVMSAHCLLAAADEARAPEDREHVTPFLWRQPHRFRLARVAAESDQSKHRWTVDTQEDLELIRRIYAELDMISPFGWSEVLALVQAHPDWLELNRHILQKPLS